MNAATVTGSVAVLPCSLPRYRISHLGTLVNGRYYSVNEYPAKCRLGLMGEFVNHLERGDSMFGRWLVTLSACPDILSNLVLGEVNLNPLVANFTYAF